MFSFLSELNEKADPFCVLCFILWVKYFFLGLRLRVFFCFFRKVFEIFRNFFAKREFDFEFDFDLDFDFDFKFEFILSDFDILLYIMIYG